MFRSYEVTWTPDAIIGICSWTKKLHQQDIPLEPFINSRHSIVNWKKGLEHLSWSWAHRRMARVFSGGIWSHQRVLQLPFYNYCMSYLTKCAKTFHSYPLNRVVQIILKLVDSPLLVWRPDPKFQTSYVHNLAWLPSGSWRLEVRKTPHSWDIEGITPVCVHANENFYIRRNIILRGGIIDGVVGKVSGLHRFRNKFIFAQF